MSHKALVIGAGVGVGVGVGGAIFVVAAPVVVPAAVTWLGFTTGGIAAGSWAASMMSAMAPTVAGGMVATLQSVGAAGLGTAGTTLVAGTGAAVGSAVGGTVGGAVGAVARFFV